MIDGTNIDAMHKTAITPQTGLILLFILHSPSSVKLSLLPFMVLFVLVTPAGVIQGIHPLSPAGDLSSCHLHLQRAYGFTFY
jgi:hypothetical protein